MCCVIGWLRPDWRFAFQRQVHQTHRLYRTQGNIFADVLKGFESVRIQEWPGHPDTFENSKSSSCVKGQPTDR